MPAVTYHCPNCGYTVKRVRTGSPVPRIPCAGCGCTAHRRVGAPTATVVETIDDGIVTRRVERMKDIEEIMAERSKMGGAKK